ncbi:MAG: hypothetical protein KKH94_06435 [Candidatus Omnitrophica bacterium]|nr:hypothetical protein [Candidatus Omnitrophota bacterium]
MKTKKKIMKVIQKTFRCIVVLALVSSMSIMPTTYAEMEVVSNVSVSTPPVRQLGGEQAADTLLRKYFRRIDSYLQANQYRLAKNELKKVYLIDPTNVQAKNYEMIIEKNKQELVKEDTSAYVQKDALLDAERKLRKKRGMSSAYERLKDRRIEEAWTEEGAYIRPSEVDLDEFERLQNLGVDQYKAELTQEATKYLKRDNYDKAISRYKDALAIDSGDLMIRELLNKAMKEREERLDDIHYETEKIEDREFMQEVTKSAIGIDEYRRGMKGHGYALPHIGRKPDIRPAIYDQMQIPITADFRDVDLVSVLNFLSDYTGINIISSQVVTSENRPITVRFKALPLERALKYIIKGQGLTFRVDDDLIYVATNEEMESEELETRIYYLEKGSGVFTTFSSSNMGSLGSSGGSASVSGMKSIKELLEDAVSFPPGAKIVFDDRTGALIVTNTPTNLKKIEEILYVVDEPPQQILIEARFIEINMQEWESLGFEADLDSSINTDVKGGAVKTAILSGTDYDFTGVANAITAATGGVNMAFGGLLTDPQYTLFLNTVARLEKTKTLSAPKITTVNNQTATIKVVTEEVFPTRFEVSLIQQDLNGDGDLDDAGETEFANVPQEFVSRDVGILLQVTPSVGTDQETITLSIVPEVSSVSATPAVFAMTNYDASGDESGLRSSGTPNLPRFTTSTLSTTVVLKSGETAVLGGLMSESIGTTEEKVPILGDIPYIGFFFRSKQDEINRTNLVIFITGRVIK